MQSSTYFGEEPFFNVEMKEQSTKNMRDFPYDHYTKCDKLNINEIKLKRVE